MIPEAAAALHHAESAGRGGGGGPGVAEQRMAAPGRSWPLFTLDSNAPKYSGGKLFSLCESVFALYIMARSLNSKFIPKTKGASFFFLPQLLKMSD